MVDSINTLRTGVIQTVSGTVDGLVTDGFILKDATGQVFVDTGKDLKLSPGESVTVAGEYEIADDGTTDFDGLKVTKADGSVILNPFGTTGSSSKDDILDGTNHPDRLSGGQGNDFLKGRAGKDTLTGGAGRDILVGDNGQDILTGGKGKDEFVYNSLAEGRDRITDFSAKKDVLNIDELFEDTTIYGSSDRFTDYVKLIQKGSGTLVRIDPDGDTGNAAFKTLATFQGVDANSLSASNFIVTG